MSDAGRVRGELLRRWRVAVLRDPSATRVMAAADVTRAAVSQWEGGTRSPAVALVHRIAALAPHHQRAFVAMFERAGTPRAFAASRRWEHNFPEGHRGPAAIWVRPPVAGPIAIRARWGVFEVRRARLVDELGLILWVPTSIHNPTLIVDLEPPGHVDFLTAVPPRALGVPVEQALRFVHRQTASGPWVTLWARYLNGRPGLLPRLRALAGGTSRDETFVAALASADRSETADVAAPVVPPESRREPISTGSAVRRARRAYGWSQSELAARASQLSGLMISQPTQSRLETDLGGADPRVAAAVDRALGADGRIVSHKLRTLGNGNGTLRLPRFWIGPVWMSATGPGTVELTSGGYRRPIELADGTRRYAFRCAGTQPFEVAARPPQPMTFGLGRVDGSIDVNDDWVPASDQDRRRILDEGYGILTRVVLAWRPGGRRAS